MLELREMGPLGISSSASSGASTDPFASALVAQAFTDIPAVPIGRRPSHYYLLAAEDLNIA